MNFSFFCKQLKELLFLKQTQFKSSYSNSFLFVRFFKIKIIWTFTSERDNTLQVTCFNSEELRNKNIIFLDIMLHAGIIPILLTLCFIAYSAKDFDLNFNFGIRRDHRKNSYVRFVNESVDDERLYLVMSQKSM